MVFGVVVGVVAAVVVAVVVFVVVAVAAVVAVVSSLLSFFFLVAVPPQINTVTGHVRPIKRMVADRPGLHLPRCPKENIPLTNFREGTNYSLVPVTKASKIEKRETKMRKGGEEKRNSAVGHLSLRVRRPPSGQRFRTPSWRIIQFSPAF